MQHQTGSRPLSLVCIAAPTDAASLSQWETYLLPLQQAGWLFCWSERHLPPGSERMAQLLTQVDQADVILLLLSADFFASKECLLLMDRALQRRQDGTTQVVPLLLRPVLWKESPLGVLSCLPANGTPVTTWGHPEEGWHACVLALQRLLKLSPSHPPGLSTGQRTHTDRERLLRVLRFDYQTIVDESLQHLAWMQLGLAEQPDAVRNAMHLLQRRPDHTERLLPAGTRVLDAYDQAEEALLILGNPGAGKSTLLRDLALHLVTRAQEDEAHPLPVILPLSFWAVSKPELSDWLVEQLARLYDVPRKLGKSWVDQGQILPLLDGLDEMEEAARPLCIAAINAYRRAHFTPLVVCSRSAEYQAALVHHRLVLQNAVVVQPLTQERIAQVIQQAGAPLTALREALQDSQDLRDLAETPLMLSVLVLAYRDTSLADFPRQREALEQRVWADYVERMVREKGAERQGKDDIPSKRYSLEQTHSWLGWLAQQMHAHNQALFYGEQLQESWLPLPLLQRTTWLREVLPAMLLGAAANIFFSFMLFSGGDSTYLSQVGLIGGFLGWCLFLEPRAPATHRSQWRHTLHIQAHRLLGSACLALLCAACFGLKLGADNGFGVYNVSDWIRDGAIFASLFLVSGWLLQVVFSRSLSFSASPDSLHVSRRSRFAHWLSTPSVRRTLWTIVILGLSYGLNDALSFGLRVGSNSGASFGPCLGRCDGLSNALRFWLSVGLSVGLNSGLSVGLSFGIAVFLLSVILAENSKMLRLAERISWTWRTLLHIRHFRASLFVTVILVCFFWLSFWLRLGGSVALIIGLIVGLSYGLSYWLLLGLYKGITQKHLEDRDRRRFNQGLSRSLRNSVLLSVLGGGILTGISLLSYGLNSWLSFEQDYGLRYGLSLGWLLFLCGWFVLWAAISGLTILHHYTLRLLLARSHTFPLQVRRFLDDATARVLLRRVGGGYGFVHRRLLDYFANTTLLSADVFETPHQTPFVPQSMAALRPGTTTSEGSQDTPFPPQDEGRER